MRKQHTIEREVWARGVGLHSGKEINMVLKPASPNFGVRFRRTDIAARPLIPARFSNVADTFHATTIAVKGATVSTIEHLMAAIVGKNIDNVLVEVDGPEVPIFDGSASHYVDLLNRAGTRVQDAARRGISIARAILVQEGDAYIRVTPSPELRIRYIIDFPHPLVGRQEKSWVFDEAAFSRDIAGARTFGFLRDIEMLQNAGLARGGSLDNAIVFDERQVMNPEGFRYADECVRHKILDFLGDLSLMGMPVAGQFELYKAGHSLHGKLVRQLMTQPESVAISTPAPTAGTVVTPIFSRFPKHMGNLVPSVG
jgi:UDP-3-O-[3-hydroxymyristoyl] N-acetylglucosamine deacetylase